MNTQTFRFCFAALLAAAAANVRADGLPTSPAAETAVLPPQTVPAANAAVSMPSENQSGGLHGQHAQAASESAPETQPSAGTHETHTGNSKFKLHFPMADDDLKIVEEPAQPEPAAEAANKKVQAKLRKPVPASAPAITVKTNVRKGAAAVPARSKAPTRTAAPAFTAPAPKPQLSRSQILQREIQAERAALARAQAQLAQAQKNGGNTAALQQAMRDRQANIRALQTEIR